MKKSIVLVACLFAFSLFLPVCALAYQNEDERLAIKMIEKALQKVESYTYYSISADDAGFWVCVTQKDLTHDAINTAKSAEWFEQVAEAKRQEVIGNCDTIYAFIKETIGIKNKILGFFILDEANRSNVLVAAISGYSGSVIVYDAMEIE
jgi:hypothetical protein